MGVEKNLNSAEMEKILKNIERGREEKIICVQRQKCPCDLFCG